MHAVRTARTILPLFAALLAGPVLADESAVLGEARGVASSIPPKLMTVLSDEISKGGPEGAIGVCRDKAPEMAKAASEQTGWGIRRVSMKNRNPKAVPDPWEQAVLEEFEQRAAAGENLMELEKGEVVTEGDRKFFRYMKALPTQEVCMNCHGTAERISAAVQAELASHYPQDKAVGYQIGQIRGALTLRKPL